MARAGGEAPRDASSHSAGGSDGGGASQASSSGGDGSASSGASSGSGIAGCVPACAADYQCIDMACAPESTCCETGTNIGPGEPSPPPMPDSYIAWPFVATCAIDVNQVQFYTDGGSWWIAADDNGMVGAVLIGGELPPSPLPQWTGGPQAQTIHLYAGQAYWIIQGTSAKPTVTTTSVAQYGKPLPFRHSATLAGPWLIGDKLMPFAVAMHSACP